MWIAFCFAVALMAPREAQPAAPSGMQDVTAEAGRVAAQARRYLTRIIRTNDTSLVAGEAPGRIIGTGVSLGGGYILTCAGIVGPAREVLVSPVPGDTVIARVVGVDRRTNVAVLKADGLGLSPIPIDDRALVFPGEMVFAVGLGAPGAPSAGFGTVVLSDGPSLGYTDVDMLQVAAPIFPGFTGGALLNREGRMVGLLSGRLGLGSGRVVLPTGTDLIAGFVRDGHVTTTDPSATTVALPVAGALEIAQELERLGFVERGYLGLQVELTEILRGRGRVMAGVMVHRVVGASPAAEAGLIPGDVILEYAGARVQSPEDLSFLVAATVPGANVPIRYVRRGVRAIAVAEIRQAPDSAWTPEMDASLAGRSGEAGVAPTVR
jgi:S1-C subfamily serine protease